jgi:hypothetical protein
MMRSKKIVGIMLVKNDEYFAASALHSVVDFCDNIVILENMANDNTYERLKIASSNYPNVSLERISDFRKSHQPLEKYAGTDTWVFGVDGDEIYDAIKLKCMC